VFARQCAGVGDGRARGANAEARFTQTGSIVASCQDFEFVGEVYLAVALSLRPNETASLAVSFRVPGSDRSGWTNSPVETVASK
jgi:hypothetical protein